MSKFKVGDFVKVVKGQHIAEVSIGDIFTVIKVEGDIYKCSEHLWMHGSVLESTTQEEINQHLWETGKLGNDENFVEVIDKKTEEEINKAVFGETKKASNPKDAIGSKKAPLSVIPCPVLYEVGLGLLDGNVKYGGHNYRAIGVRSSVYYDATMRHLMRYWEGQDIDPDSGIHHVSKAISSLVVLRDAMIQGKCFDDRPPATQGDWMVDMNEKAKGIVEKIGEDAAEPFLEINRKDWDD